MSIRYKCILMSLIALHIIIITEIFLLAKVDITRIVYYVTTWFCIDVRVVIDGSQTYYL